MAGLRTVRGKEPIVVWRRTSWTSMPHLTSYQERGIIGTRCGNEVSLGVSQVVGIVLTQIGTDLFLAVGCGLCRMSMVRDLRDELLAARPDAKAQLRKILKDLEWEELS
jgi:hypothetical protein